MKKVNLKIISNKEIAPKLFELKIQGDTTGCNRPGSFVNIKIPDFYLRRPISIADSENDILTLIYKVVGEGTEKLATLTNENLDVLTGIGNGFNTYDCSNKPLLIGGGAGVAPLYFLAKKLISENKIVTVIMGFNKKEEIYYLNEFQALGAKVIVTTIDGSFGINGFVTDAMKDLDYTNIYSCGPMAMMKAINAISKTSGQYSLEARMGCGFGACLGCLIETKYGPKRICKEGPVFNSEEILW